ncbi:MAG: phasin family protein [Desulfovibrionaceae bacterium]|nr:phasin family protein [Desulfovibrionaceae bacterium]
MSSNAYQQFFEAQKAMFEEWRNYMKTAYARDLSAAQASAPDPADFYKKIVDAPQDFWKKAEESYKSYQAVFELWKKLAESEKGLDSDAATQIYDEWSKRHFALIRDNLTPNLPGQFKEFTEKFLENMESSSTLMSDYFKSWAASGESLQEAFYGALAKGPKGYPDFMSAWQKNYDETFGRMVNAPTFGKDMEFWKQQKTSFDKFIKYNIAVNKFYSSIMDIAQDATKKALEDYAEMLAKGTQHKSFEEFYKYWSKLVSDAYQKVLLSDEMSSLAGNMVNEMSKFKIEYDKLCEIYLKYIPVPKKSEMEELYRTVYELKKELRDLKEELHK